MNPETPLLLDTHILFWFMTKDSRLSASHVNTIGKSVAGSRVKISVISIWELAMLEMKGRIVFSMDLTEWVKRAIAAPGFSLAPLTPDIAIDSTRLPGEFHGDPADRILVATARILNAEILTRDQKILGYARQKHVRAVSAA